MTMRRMSFMTLAVACAAACYTSPPVERFPLARKPGGIGASIRMANGRSIDGELLAVNDTAYVVSWNQYVGVVRYADVKAATLEGIGAVNLWETTKPTRDVLYRARLMSRFPYGIPDTALAELLGTRQQTAMLDFAVFTPPGQ